MKEWKLWIAQYPFTVPNLDTGKPFIPGGRTNWTIWQYTAKGKGTQYGLARSNAADLDVFNGTAQEFRDWLKIKGSGEGIDIRSKPK